MADVNRNRGQLILITALLIAIAMVALVLLLNTAIYTENLASRGADQSGREATEYRATMTERIGGLIDAENDREHEAQAAVDANVTDGIATVDDYTARMYGAGGTVARVNQSTVTLHEGKLIRHTDETRQFLDKDGDGTLTAWELATALDGARHFSLSVDRSSLITTNDTLAETEGAFAVEVVESGVGGDAWKVFVYENKSTGDVAVATMTTGALTPTERCSVDRSEVTINLTAETVGGSDCPGLIWAEGVDPTLDIKYHNGDNATGTYHLNVNTSGTGSVNGGNLNTSGQSPYYVPAVYSTEVHLYYESPTLRYRTQVRVAPGEPE